VHPRLARVTLDVGPLDLAFETTRPGKNRLLDPSRVALLVRREQNDKEQEAEQEAGEPAYCCCRLHLITFSVERRPAAQY
jgi:hypothetical protein